MFIREVNLTNYRNYITLEMAFNQGVNILYGENAQGKTNLIEAIYMCSTSKSHRLSKDKEIIRLGEKEAHIHVSFERDEMGHDIDMHMTQRGPKKVAVDKQPIKKMNQLFGQIHVIMFSPEDLGIIKNGPKDRRRFIDMELSQLNPLYMYYLSQYHKVLKQRNQLLKNQDNHGELGALLDVFDEQLIGYGLKVIELRESFVEQLDAIYHEKHKDLSGNRELVHVVYERSVSIDDYKKSMQEKKATDIRMRTTTIGPHRDDLSFVMNDIDLRTYGSQGQQRTAALALKLSEIILVKESTNETPILLLDDVLSELDHHRQTYLIHHLEGIQTFITCTGVEDVIKIGMGEYQLYEVENATIQRR